MRTIPSIGHRSRSRPLGRILGVVMRRPKVLLPTGSDASTLRVGMLAQAAPACPDRDQSSRGACGLVRVLANVQPLGKQNRHLFAASAATQPDLAVEEFPRQVEMPSMSGGLLDHVQHDPANIWWLVRPVPTAWRHRKWGCGEH
jgi:hypothetical protein